MNNQPILGNTKAGNDLHIHIEYLGAKTLCRKPIQTRIRGMLDVSCPVCLQKHQLITEGTLPEINPAPQKVIDIDNLIRRVERLEMIEKARGDLFLFIVDTKGNSSYLVTGFSFESVKQKFPLQENIEYIGMANSKYRTETIIQSW